MLFSPREIKNCKKWMNGLKQTNFLSMQKNLFFFSDIIEVLRNNMPLALSILGILGADPKRKASTKFLGVLDENLAWKDHINTLENKIS